MLQPWQLDVWRYVRLSLNHALSDRGSRFQGSSKDSASPTEIPAVACNGGGPQGAQRNVIFERSIESEPTKIGGGSIGTVS